MIYMEKITLYQISSMKKAYLDMPINNTEIFELSALKNEKISYQIAYKASEPTGRYDVKIEVESELSPYINVRFVGNVPSSRPVSENFDEHYERTAPGLFPDVLLPIENNKIEVLGTVWHSLWLTVKLDGNVKGGKYPITVNFKTDDFTVSKTMSLEVIDAKLPKQELIYTQWFHGDCLADYYKTKIFSEKHWEIMELFVKTAVENGVNMILTPIFTPPLDTAVGGERTTIQLIDITKTNGNYSFDFENLKRWIKMCQSCGIEYFEMAHLFTQWGMAATPKIIATVDGKKQRIFGWDVPSDSEEYFKFLADMLPALDNFLGEMGIRDKCFYHISDEPYKEHLERYKSLKAKVKKIMPDITIIDALSDYDFYSEGVVDLPIPATDAIGQFIENGVPSLWSYYCCAQTVGVSNRFMSMPSYRNRIIGLQLYKFDVKGFLHWGYNFYNSALSKKTH